MKKIMILSLITTIVLGQSSSYAASIRQLESKQRENMQTIKQSQNKKVMIEKNLSVLLDEIGQKEIKIEESQSKIKKIEDYIIQKEKQIMQQEKSVQSLEEVLQNKKGDVQRKKEIIKNYFLLIYMQEETDILDFLMSADDFYDFFDRVFALKLLLVKNENLHQKLKNEIEEYKNAQQVVKEKMDRLEKEQEELQLLKDSLQLEKDQQEEALNETKQKRTQLKNELEYAEDVIDQLVKETEELEQQMEYERKRLEEEKRKNRLKGKESVVINGTTPADIAYKWVKYRGTGSSNPVIYSMPKRQLDLKTYGDCSSFTRRVFMDAGYGDIGYITAEQITNPKGQFISNLSQIKVNDLLFFGPTGDHRYAVNLPNGKRAAVAHVGIYIGNDQMIDLSASVGTISIKDISEGTKWGKYVQSRFIGAKRFSKK